MHLSHSPVPYDRPCKLEGAGVPGLCPACWPSVRRLQEPHCHRPGTSAYSCCGEPPWLLALPPAVLAPDLSPTSPSGGLDWLASPWGLAGKRERTRVKSDPCQRQCITFKLPSPIFWMTLAKLLNFSVPQLPHL